MTRLTIILGLLVNALPAHSHDIYHDWKTRTGVSCCNQTDCAPATMWRDNEGRLIARQNGQTYSVPEHSVLPIPSPDGRSHLCVIGGYPICAVIGEVRS